MTTIVRFAFRELQNYLATQHNKKIRPITHEEERKIRSPMIQCRKWMSKQGLQTFFKFIMYSHKCNPIVPQITLEEANKLYLQLMQLIKNASQKKNILQEKKKMKETLRIQQNISKAIAEKKEKVKILTAAEERQQIQRVKTLNQIFPKEQY